MKLCAWKVVLLFIKQSTDITKAKYPTLSKFLIMYQWSRIVFIVILLFFVTNNNAGDGVCMNKQDCSENNVETQENLNLYAEGNCNTHLNNHMNVIINTESLSTQLTMNILEELRRQLLNTNHVRKTIAVVMLQ